VTAIADLQAAFGAEIAKISDALVKAKANYLLERYAKLAATVESLQEGKLASYTIGDRTVTRRELPQMQTELDRMEMRLKRMIYGRVVLIDMNLNQTDDG
jgi:hypothetical protein